MVRARPDLVMDKSNEMPDAPDYDDETAKIFLELILDDLLKGRSERYRKEMIHKNDNIRQG